MKDEDEKIWYLEDVTSTSVHETNFAVTGYLEDSAHWSIFKNLIWKITSFRHPKWKIFDLFQSKKNNDKLHMFFQIFLSFFITKTLMISMDFWSMFR